MQDDRRASPQGLYTALAARARQSPDSLLVALESLGLIATLAVFFWLPARPGLAMPFFSIAMFGLWGVAEHVRRNRAERLSRLEGMTIIVVQASAVIAGSLAAGLAVYAALGSAMGTFIS